MIRPVLLVLILLLVWPVLTAVRSLIVLHALFSGLVLVIVAVLPPLPSIPAQHAALQASPIWQPPLSGQFLLIWPVPPIWQSLLSGLVPPIWQSLLSGLALAAVLSLVTGQFLVVSFAAPALFAFQLQLPLFASAAPALLAPATAC